MSTLEDKLEAIEAKVTKLIEQNIQYKRICEDLLGTRRQLEKENKALNEMLDRIAVELDAVTSSVDDISLTLMDEEQTDKEENISKYIQDITDSINRLK